MELTVKNSKGKDTTTKVKLHAGIYGIEPNDHAIYLDVKQHLANKRQGTAKAKERGEITGSTRKIKKQKGTGTARMGSIKSPVLRGGGRVFGPEPRDYHHKLNKKLKQLARKSALSYKAKEGSILVIDKFDLDGPKTKQFAEILENLKVADKKSLVVLDESNKSIYLSSRNLQKSKVVSYSELSSYEIMNADNLILSKGSIEKIEALLS